MKLAMLCLVLFMTCLSSANGQAKEATLELKLDKVMLERPCPRQRNYPAKYRTCPDDGTNVINVEAALSGKIRKKPRYEFSVSGGTIVGTGPKIIWDMSKAMPGTTPSQQLPTLELKILSYRQRRPLRL